MQQSRKHSLSPERSPNPGRYEEGEKEEDEDENLLERSIKKLKIDSGHVNVPFSRPMNKRFPAHVEAPDDPYYMHDINFPAVNKVLNELAIIREFREKVKKLKESKNMPPISEHDDYQMGDATRNTLQPPLQTVLNFVPYHDDNTTQGSSESSSGSSSSSGGGSSIFGNNNNCGSPMAMETED